MKLITWGYTGGSLDTLQQLAAEGVALVDVRYSPRSRNPLRRIAHLEQVLGSAYHWFPALGNVNYRGGPIRIPRLAVGLAMLGELLEKQSVCVFCVCRQWQGCHRAEIVAAAQTRWPGLEVEHLP